MLKHLGFVCWISCDGKELPVYGEECRENVRSAWIPSEAGKNFSVFWQDRSGKRVASSGHVFVDGKDVASAIIRPGRSTPVQRAGVKRSSHRIKPFTFSELSLTDDDNLANRYDASLRDVGAIKVEIKRVRLGKEVPFAGYDAQNHGLVHERAKKAGAHCTKFGDEERSESPRTVAVTTAPYDPNEPGPYVIFEFFYRSQDMLKANGILENERKRMNESGDDAIEIETSDDEERLTPPHLVSQTRDVLRTPSKKRVKREPQTDKIPSVLECNTAEERHDESSSDAETLTESPAALSGSSSETLALTSGALADQTKLPMKKEEGEGEDEEELDMLADDDDGNFSTYPSQNVALYDLPPPSSSPGPETLEDEDLSDS